jgi:hypothetical protein
MPQTIEARVIDCRAMPQTIEARVIDCRAMPQMIETRVIDCRAMPQTIEARVIDCRAMPTIDEGGVQPVESQWKKTCVSLKQPLRHRSLFEVNRRGLVTGFGRQLRR